jgi:hypothetical protein
MRRSMPPPSSFSASRAPPPSLASTLLQHAPFGLPAARSNTASSMSLGDATFMPRGINMSDVSPDLLDRWAFNLQNMDNHDRETFAHTAREAVHPSTQVNLALLRRQQNGRVQGQGALADRMDNRLGTDLKRSSGNSRPGGKEPASLRTPTTSSASSSSSSSSGSSSSSSKRSSVIDLSDLSDSTVSSADAPPASMCPLTDKGKELRKRILEYFSDEFAKNEEMDLPDDLVGTSEEESLDSRLVSVINAMARAGADVPTTIGRLRNAKRQK